MHEWFYCQLRERVGYEWGWRAFISQMSIHSIKATDSSEENCSSEVTTIHGITIDIRMTKIKTKSSFTRSRERRWHTQLQQRIVGVLVNWLLPGLVICKQRSDSWMIVVQHSIQDCIAMILT